MPGPASDPIYNRLRDESGAHHERGRQYLEFIWEQCSDYVDAGAARRATDDLIAVFWELQLAMYLIFAKKSLVPRNRLAYQRNMGPDLFAADQPGVWLEAIAVRSGSGPDRPRAAVPGTTFSYEPDAVILRLRSAISEKSRKLRHYIQSGVIKPGQAAMIGISGLALPYRFSGRTPPEIVRAVYPVGNPVLEIDRETMTVTGSHVQYKDRVRKLNAAEVRTDVFLDPSYSHISAVLFDESSWVDGQIPPRGEPVLVHNPLAEWPLPDGWLPLGSEFWWREGMRVESVRHGSS